MIYFCLLLVSLLVPAIVDAGTYWVSPTGTAPWASCQSTTDPGENYCSLNTANTSAVAGDVVNLKEGTYTSIRDISTIEPTHSGTSDNIITFQSAPGEQAVLNPTDSASYVQAIGLWNVSYIKIYRINVYDSPRFFRFGSASHNELSHCNFELSTGISSISCLSSGGTCGDGSQHNWIHHNTFTKYGGIVACEDGGYIGVGSGSASDASYYNTIEDNVFSYGGHDLLNLSGTKYNVVRNNVFHNEEVYFSAEGQSCNNNPVSGYFGNRCLILENSGTGSTDRNLIESNRVGHTGTPPDDDGSNGIEDAAENTINRYNFTYDCGTNGIYSKNQGTGNNHARVYNNTVYHAGYGDASLDSQFKNGIQINSYNLFIVHDIIVKNNLLSNTARTVIQGITSQYCVDCFAINNSFEADPSFLNTSITDKTSTILPDLSLHSYSSVIDGGTHLTLANGSGDASETLTVDDALYFQDGTLGSSLSNIQPDWIAIGTVTNTVQISSIDYSTKTITLASPMTWANDAPVWLYKKSDAEIVLRGSAPDYGAYEYRQLYKNHGSPKSMMSRPPS